MNDFFIKVYLDEDVHILVAEFVRLGTFTALTVSEARRKGVSDAEQLNFAAKEGYAILTHNRTDYEDLAKDYFVNNRQHFGVIIAVRRPPRDIAERLLNTINNFTADEMKNQVIYI